ncbi:MAG: AAA family ATPase [Deltaproteobacteria bacterium]|nr:AAA family ATPase [Deltaproteobacteria bacterium]
MAELDTITIKGFKSIRAIECLQLEPVTVLIGPNGSGKSNFIGVFEFLHAIREGALQDYVARAGGADRILHFGSSGTEEVRLHVSFTEGVNQYEIALKASETDQLYVNEEWVSFWDKRKYQQPYSESLIPNHGEAGISSPDCGRIGNYVRRHLGSWRLFHFHDTSSKSPMKKTADLNDNRFLRPNGSNLAPFLYFLREQHETSYRLIRRTVQRVAPFFDDFQLEPQKLNPDKIRLEWKHKGSDSYFDASSLSDGTLRFIALTALFLQPGPLRPSVVVVDEPELGLHPFAITMLASLVKQSSAETQVLLSTQSPVLLDHFDPKQVLVADRINGATELAPLDPDRLAAWLEDYSLGQLWEKNELGGRPATERRDD